jgi:hypothetical protein
MAPKDKNQAAFEHHAPDEDYEEAGKGPPAEASEGANVQDDVTLRSPEPFDEATTS